MKYITYGARGSRPTPLGQAQLSQIITKFLLVSEKKELDTLLTKYQRSEQLSVLDSQKSFQDFNDIVSKKLLALPYNYSSNTPCVEIRLDDTERHRKEQIFFDLGTGACNAEILPETEVLHIFLSHFHYDHIQGMLFFSPLYNKNIKVHLYSPSPGFEQYLNELMKHPYFPITMPDALANIHFHELDPKKSITINGMKVTPKSVNHPGGCYVYRVDYKKKSFGYFSDVNIEKFLLRKTKENIAFFSDLDCIVIDSSMLFHDIPEKRFFGHSNVYAGIDFINTWNIKSAYLFHFDPTDDMNQLNILYQCALWYNKMYSSKSKIALATEGEIVEV